MDGRGTASGGHQSGRSGRPRYRNRHPDAHGDGRQSPGFFSAGRSVYPGARGSARGRVQHVSSKRTGRVSGRSSQLEPLVIALYLLRAADHPAQSASLLSVRDRHEESVHFRRHTGHFAERGALYAAAGPAINRRGLGAGRAPSSAQCGRRAGRPVRHLCLRSHRRCCGNGHRL